MIFKKRAFNIVLVVCLAVTLFWFPATIPAQTPAEERPGKLDKDFNPCKPGQTTPPCGRTLTHPVQTEREGGYSYAAATQPADGKVVVAGTYRGAFALARFNPDGTFDQNFGEKGTVQTPLPGSRNRLAPQIGPTLGLLDDATEAGISSLQAFALAIQDDGKI